MRILIVDDEPIVRRDLERLLKLEADIDVVGMAANGLEALDQIDALNPDVVLLDVEMPELDGLGVAQALDSEKGPLVVFVTAHHHYALAAFDAEAVDYLLKPFGPERLARTLDRLRARLDYDARGNLRKAQHAALQVRPYLERFAVRASNRAIVFAVDQVRRIEGSGNYAKLHVGGASYLTRRTMQELQLLLDPAHFVRVHRSHIVQIAQIREFRLLGDGDAQVLLQGG
jgi:DNA-binding LytR/AlgR family response regulator